MKSTNQRFQKGKIAIKSNDLFIEDMEETPIQKRIKFAEELRKQKKKETVESKRKKIMEIQLNNKSLKILSDSD